MGRTERACDRSDPFTAGPFTAATGSPAGCQWDVDDTPDETEASSWVTWA
jgi:hypothetical protein